ncbi:MAG: NADP-dependent oxidoreductase [Alphaproteobacteria bacterium]
MSVNRQWCVGERPVGKPKYTDFLYKEAPIQQPGEGEVLLETLYLGIAPVMRMYMMNLPAGGEPPLDIGDVIHGRGVARVLESCHPDYEAGEIVQGQLGWQTHKISKMTKRERFFKVKHHDLSYAHSVRILSMTGLTAYTSFYDQGQPKKGETVVVSGAAGGVGHMVVQMAKIEGCRVIGIAGGAEKCAVVKRLGADEVIDYKNDNVPEKIKELCSDGLDIYYDNVGGEILSACLDNLAYNARIVLCGSISEYTRDEKFGLTNYAMLRRSNAAMHGYFVYNYLDQFDSCNDQLAKWIRSGEMTPLIDELVGFEKMPEALVGVYEGSNIGTRCVKVKLND